MAGPDAVRGIAYQQAQAVAEALAIFDNDDAAAVRVEGVHDVVDVETLTVGGDVLSGKQVKIRAGEYTWGKAELVGVLRRWATLPAAGTAEFEFLTDGRLGPTGERVQAALEQARGGDLAALAALLEEDVQGDVCRRLTRATVRLDPVSVGAVLLRAERQVAAMLPAARTTEDLRELSQAAVDRLFRLLMERAGHPDPAARVVDRREIAGVLGIPADHQIRHRWPGELRQRYVRTAADLRLDDVTTPTLRHGRTTTTYEGSERQQDLSVLAALAQPTSLLAGRTGTGKTTVCRVIVRDAARADQVALLAHAEAYLPGRLEALAADALSEIVREDIPTATGRQILADGGTTLVIDGVSEVPEIVRHCLADDLRVHVASQRGSRIVLVGRDVAALRAVLPSVASPAAFEVAPLERGHRSDLVRVLLAPSEGTDKGNGEQAIATIVAQVEHALGDAARNPLMFKMATLLLADGVHFQDRAALYGGFLEHLAQRTGTTDFIPATTALGVVFAQLLDGERRYADPYEWASLIEQAVAGLAVLKLDAGRVDAAARRSGIVTSLGYVQTVVPMHDSMADYLAGVAHARGAVALPERLRRQDEQRLAFYAQLRGLDATTAMLLARDLPFLAASLAAHDERELSLDTPQEVAGLLEVLLTGRVGVGLWRQEGRVVAVELDGESSRWLSDEETRGLLTRVKSTTARGGPLSIAVRMWRQRIKERLQIARGLGQPRPKSLSEVCDLLTEHATREAAELVRLIGAVVPEAAHNQVLGGLGPLGLTAWVSEESDGLGGRDWEVSYQRTGEVDVRPAQDTDPEGPLTGRSSAMHLLSDAPERNAASRLAATINGLVGHKWL